jgi:hypothetical protein
VIREAWDGTSPEHVVKNQSGPLIRIRHPKYTEDEPYEDIPIMVSTHKQWKNVEKEDLVVSAAPFPPGEIGRNARYLFATPPRFHYDFAKGYEEVLDILGKQPQTFAPAKHIRSTGHRIERDESACCETEQRYLRAMSMRTTGRYNPRRTSEK